MRKKKIFKKPVNLTLTVDTVHSCVIIVYRKSEKGFQKTLGGIEMNIKGIIEGVENGEIKLSDDPTFSEWEFENGTEYFIEFFVDGYEGDDYIQVLFPEQDHIKEAREKNRVGDMSDEELEELLADSSNGYDDMFNFDKVVAISSEPMGLEWL